LKIACNEDDFQWKMTSKYSKWNISAITTTTTVRKQVLLISIYFTTIPDGRTAGRVGGVNENKAKLSQPAGAGVGVWLSLAIPRLDIIKTLKSLSLY
jgi:hypothetical protein